MRYLPRSPLLPSPTHTSPRSSPNWERCSRLALLCLSRSCQLLTVTVAAPALQMDCPNLLCFSQLLPVPFPFFFFFYTPTTCYQPLSLQMDCPNLFALATCYGHFSLPRSADGLPRSALLIILILLALQMGCPLFWPYTLSTY